MGTKVEYGIDVLAPCQKSSSFSVHSVDESDYYRSQSQGLNHSFQITGLDKYHNKMPEKHNIDFIRKTMQIHEDIFKQQVRELHRVYSVQKMLMEEMKNNKKHRNYRNMDHYEMSPRERSGSCSSDHHHHQIKTGGVVGSRGFDLETVNLVAEDQDVSTAGVSRNDDDDEDEIELTLSIGGSGRRSSKKLKLKLKNEQLQESSSTTPTFDQQIRKHPHWLFHGLSINKTSSSTG